MAKKKIGLANKKLQKKSQNYQKSVSSNPFEIHLNKRKYDIIGRKNKHERGLPGVSRSRATKKRQKTLLVEYHQRHKANTFIDHRFGEYDEQMSVEEKLMKRFTMEKQRHHGRTGLYNLENEELTHLGQTLGDIDRFDDVRLSDEEEEDDAEDVKDMHFGGFLKKKKTSGDDAGGDMEEEKHKTRKEIMEEVVAKSKLKKHERQMMKEEITDLTEQVDKDWLDIKNLLSQRGMESKKPEEKPKADEYDMAVRELAYEIKGKATDRLKTEEELARQEEERLNKLEAERIRRMKGLPQIKEKPQHISADDLGDSFTVESDSRFLVKYQAGKMIMPESEQDSDLGTEQDSRDNRYYGHDVEGSNEDEDDSDEEESEGVDSGSDLESEAAVSDDDDDNDDDDDDDEGDNIEKDETRKLASTPEQNRIQESKNKDISAATKELPYTFIAPKSYQEFKSLLDGWSIEDQFTIIERIKACHHPKISPANKTKMEVFFTILMEYIGDLALQSPPAVTTIDRLTRHVFDVAQHSRVHCAQCVQGIIQNIQDEFVQQCDRKGGRGRFPGLRELTYLKIVPILFPTSDFRHAVCTPALLLMAQILSQCPVQTLRDVISGLFVCNLVFKYVSLSKRFVPEVVNFLTGILYYASEKKQPALPLVPPFRPNSKWNNILEIHDSSITRSISKERFSLKEALQDEPDKATTDSMRVNAVGLCVHLLDKFADLYNDLPSYDEIFKAASQHLARIPVTAYSQYFQDQFSSLGGKLSSQEDKLRRVLTLQARKPQPIKTFEPKFEEHYEIKARRNIGNKVINERQKLRYKHKKEFKGAAREIRKDNQFLAKQKLKEQMIRDAERAKKVKEIEQMLASERGEANLLNRKKRKLK